MGVRANDAGRTIYAVAFDDDDQDDNVIERHILPLPAPAPAAEEADDDATAPYPCENDGSQPRRRPRDAALDFARQRAVRVLSLELTTTTCVTSAAATA